MYVIKVLVKDSEIEGRGVFSLDEIPSGTITWKFEPQVDVVMAPEDFEKLDIKAKEQFLRIAYLSPTTGRWVYQKEGESANFTNHSSQPNQSMVVDLTISEEPFFVANTHIVVGDELTVNYAEFDDRPENLLENWAK